MDGILGRIDQKLFRAREALHLILRASADGETRRTLIHIYRSLSNRERYDEEVSLNLRFGATVLPCTMRLSDIFILGEILFEGQYRLRSDVPAGGTILDCGGNVGISALWFLGHYRPKALHVFEPAAETFGFLEANLGGHDGVILNRAAVGRAPGEVTLYHQEFAGMHSLNPAGSDGHGGETVPLLTLADYLDRHGIQTVDLLKLDIEGSELDALAGLGERLSDVSVIVGEVHDDLVDTRAFYAHLEKFSFRVLWKKEFHEGPASHVHNFEAVRQGPPRPA